MINGRKHVHCKLCESYLHLVKQHKTGTKVPSIVNGFVGLRTNVIKKHLESIFHTEAHKSYTEDNKKHENNAISLARIPALLSLEKQKLYGRIARLMILIYGDIKRKTVAPWSFAARFVAMEMSANFRWENSETCLKLPEGFSFQYLTCYAYREMQNCIVKADLKRFSNEIKGVMAAGIHSDGSVDRTAKDKVYNIAVCVNAEGHRKDYFIGMDIPTLKGAAGYLQVLESSAVNLLNQGGADILFNVCTSMTTDGATANTGKKTGFWKRFQEKYKKKILRF